MASLKSLIGELDSREYVIAEKKSGAEAPDVEDTHEFSDGSVWFVVEEVEEGE